MEWFFNASIIVKILMLILLLASIISWTIIFNKYYLYSKIIRSQIKFEKLLLDANKKTLQEQYNLLCKKHSKLLGIEKIYYLGMAKILKNKSNVNYRAIEEYMLQNSDYESAILQNKLTILATIQSASPYIGLLGTVWGIMHAMQGLSIAGSVTIAMVAPGISEALIATAIGLTAAIPAGMAYNIYTNKTNTIGIRDHKIIYKIISILGSMNN